jgi:hypothetical protein
VDLNLFFGTKVGRNFPLLLSFWLSIKKRACSKATSSSDFVINADPQSTQEKFTPLEPENC